MKLFESLTRNSLGLPVCRLVFMFVSLLCVGVWVAVCRREGEEVRVSLWEDVVLTVLGGWGSLVLCMYGTHTYVHVCVCVCVCARVCGCACVRTCMHVHACTCM